jgi:hypothetical protein
MCLGYNGCVIRFKTMPSGTMRFTIPLVKTRHPKTGLMLFAVSHAKGHVFNLFRSPAGDDVVHPVTEYGVTLGDAQQLKALNDMVAYATMDAMKAAQAWLDLSLSAVSPENPLSPVERLRMLQAHSLAVADYVEVGLKRAGTRVSAPDGVAVSRMPPSF